MKSTIQKALGRPLNFLVMLLVGFGLVHAGLYIHTRTDAVRHHEENFLWEIATSALGLTDLCIATEARYTRHPAVTDMMVPFMDHPGAIEHFPTGSFWAPPYSVAESEKR